MSEQIADNSSADADWPEVEIYTDGACSGNPGPGGWAAILRAQGREKVLTGFAPETTNNRMELTAVLEGLKALKRPCRVTIFSDSAYLVNAIQQGWLQKWQMNQWRRGKKLKDPVLNADLWQELARLLQTHRVRFEKVEGHAGHELNERADRLAVEAIQRGSSGAQARR